MMMDVEKENFKHNKQILDGVNIISEINKRTIVQESGVEFSIIKRQSGIESRSSIPEIENIGETFSNIFSKYKIILIL